MSWLDDLKNSYIKSAYVAASADLKISYTESLAILKTAKSSGVTATEIADLQAVYTNAATQYSSDYVKAITKNLLYGNTANAYWWGGVTDADNIKTLGNLATDFSETNYQYLLDKWFAGTDLPMPVIGGDTATGKTFDGSYAYSMASGPLFVSGVAATDVNQGSSGTCYLLACLGAIANGKPDVINNMFVDNGNGTYGVRFYDSASTPLYVTVNKQLPVTDWGSLALAGDINKSLSGELWVALAEKAYAELNSQLDRNSNLSLSNSYQAVEGGWAAPFKQIGSLNYNYYSSYYTQNSDKYQLNYYYSTNSATYKQQIIDGLKAGEVGWLSSFGVSPGSNGKKELVSGHAYMILGYNSTTDKFIIRNPWGGDGSSDFNPQFEKSIDEFWNPTIKGSVALTTTASAPTYDYTISTAATSSNPVTEGDAVTFTITRTATDPTSAPAYSVVYVSTNWNTTAGAASPDLDFVKFSKQAVTFDPNETSKTITVNTLTDSLTEGNEYFFLNLYKNAADSTWDSWKAAYIKDPTATQSFNYTLTSNAGSTANAVAEGTDISFTITRSGSGATSTVYLSTAAGTAGNADYSALNKQELTFAANETSKTVKINTYTDTLTEGTENFSLQLHKTQVSTSAAASTTAYIKDATTPNYSYSVSSNSSSTNPVAEGSDITFTITRSSTGSASTVFVGTLNGTADATDYVGINKQAITFDAFETTKTISVKANADWWLETTESFDLAVYKNLSDSTATTKGTAYIADKTVDPYNYTITSSAASTSPVTEGGTITFTITRSGDGTTDTASTVYVSTAPGTAGNADYAALDKQVITFAANETSKTVTVNAFTDALTEGTENFNLNLYKNFADSSYSAWGSGYIKDPETTQNYSYTVTSNANSSVNAVAEGNSASFTITRSGSGSVSTVYVSTEGGSASEGLDYTSVDKQALTFAANETSKTVTVKTLTDALTEDKETFYLDLYKNYSDKASDYASYGTAYIKDVALANYSYTITSNADSSSPVNEGDAVSFTITRSGSGSASTVYIDTQNGTAGSADYAALSKQAFSFAAYETSKTVSVNTYTDSLTEDTEYFWLKLYKNAADTGYSTYSTAYIKDTTAAQSYTYTLASAASTSNTAVTEGSTISFTVTRSGSGTVSTVYVSTDGGTATEGSDYASLDKQAVTFAANETSRTVSVKTYTDSLTESNENFNLNLYNGNADSNYLSYAQGYIKDPTLTQDYSYSITSNASTAGDAVTEGNSASFTITRSGSGSASSVYLSTEGGSATEDTDFAALDKQLLSFAANETSKTVTVKTYTDTLKESAESFYLNLYKNYADGSTAYATYGTAYIKDPANPVNYNYVIVSHASTSNPASEGGTASFTIKRSGSGTASTVYLSTEEGSASNADYAALDKQAVNFSANETSKTVSVNIYTDTLTEGQERFWLNLYKSAAATTESAYAAAYIKDAIVQNYTYSVSTDAGSNSAVEEGSPISFTITRSGSGTASTVYVSTEGSSATEDLDYVALDKLAVKFTADETSKTVTVTTNSDALTEGKESFYLGLYKNYADSLSSYVTYATAYIDDPSTATNARLSSSHDTAFTALDKINTISHFQSGSDSLIFSQAVFNALAEKLGPLNADEFYAAPGAVGGHDADDRLVYDTHSGKLYYDADGNGAEVAVQVALIGVDAHPTLLASDIQVIA